MYAIVPIFPRRGWLNYGTGEEPRNLAYMCMVVGSEKHAMRIVTALCAKDYDAVASASGFATLPIRYEYMKIDGDDIDDIPDVLWLNVKTSMVSKVRAPGLKKFAANLYYSLGISNSRD